MRGCLYTSHISYPRFLTLFIEAKDYNVKRMTGENVKTLLKTHRKIAHQIIVIILIIKKTIYNFFR